MTHLLLMLIIMLNRSQHVKSTFSDTVYDKMNGIKNFVIGTYTVMQTRVRDLILSTKQNPPATTSRTPHRNTMSIFRSQPLSVPHIGRPEANVVITRLAHILTTPQLAATHGRIIETHVAYTLDGYILTLHRLQPNKEQVHSDNRVKRTVLIHHGLLGSSADWLLAGPKKSLPYILADAGHDVWLANSRGNYYSRSHVSKNYDSDEYWNFSWQEIGERDLPASLEYIRKTNNSTEPIDYIGHSMGATSLLVLLSFDHNYNSYIRLAFLLAPLAFMTHTRGPLQMLAMLSKPELRNLFGVREFMPARQTPSMLANKMCNEMDVYCENPLFFLTGGPMQEGSRTAEFTDHLQEYVPSGGSTKTILHYLELINSKEFHHYEKRDWKFKLKYISTPLLILSSNDDMVSNASDNQMLYLTVLNPVGHIIIKDQKFSHNEFVWGFDADSLIYYKIRDLIDLGPDVIKV